MLPVILCSLLWVVTVLLCIVSPGHNLSYRFFEGENEDSQLSMLDINDMRRIPSPLGLEMNCELVKGASTYTGCDGMDVPFSSSLFAIQNITPQGPYYFYALKVRKTPCYTGFNRYETIDDEE